MPGGKLPNVGEFKNSKEKDENNISFGRFIGKEFARGLCDWERRQNMSDWQLQVEKERQRQEKEKRRNEAFKKTFGVYPDQVWKW